MNKRKAILLTVVAIAAFSAAKADDHIHRTMWGWVWNLTPKPDWPHGIRGVTPMDQLVACPNGDLTLPPWHVFVLWDDDAPLRTFPRWFLQERGR